MERASMPVTTPPTYDSTLNSWVYTDAVGNRVVVDPADGPPVPTFDTGSCEWKDKVSGLPFLELVGMDSTKMPAFIGGSMWIDPFTHQQILPGDYPELPYWDYTTAPASWANSGCYEMVYHNHDYLWEARLGDLYITIYGADNPPRPVYDATLSAWVDVDTREELALEYTPVKEGDLWVVSLLGITIHPKDAPQESPKLAYWESDCDCWMYDEVTPAPSVLYDNAMRCWVDPSMGSPACIS